MTQKINVVKNYLLQCQDRICAALEKVENADARFHEDVWRNSEMSGGRTRVLQGDTFERAGVNFSHVSGKHLPATATEKRPDLAGSYFEAVGVSSVIHPRNPFVPTTHMNVRFFSATKKNGEIVWWFGGGYDLTPYYAIEEDCVHWHKTAKKACDVIHSDYYARFKKSADEYFYLKHRQECRGIGGLFFDDLNDLSFEETFLFLQNVGNSFLDAYIPIVQKRKNYTYEKKHRDFQCYRRGRYVEFNLVYDRGTLFGLQFGGRIESILISLPPQVQWHYNWQPEPNSEEARLTEYFLKPRDWIHLISTEAERHT